MTDGWDLDDDLVMVGGGDEKGGEVGKGDAEEEDDWGLLTSGDLAADLEACSAGGGGGGGGASSYLESAGGQEDLQLVLQQGAVASGAAFNADAFFAAPRALHSIAAEMQGVLAEVETLQFEAARLAGTIAGGPMRPPGGAGAWPGRAPEDVFGPSAKPGRPPQLELSPLSEASQFQDYESRLAALPGTQFLPRPLRLCAADVDAKQDKKDISRDALVVNGVAVSGAQGGYEAAVLTIAEALRSGEEAAWPTGGEERAAQLVLSVLNRTSSGFAAFEEVLRVFDCHDVVIISPDSAAARPLEAALVGGVALGRAHTRYAVRRADADEAAPVAVVDAEFCFRVSTSDLRALTTSQGEGGTEWPSRDVGATVLLRRT